MMFGAHNINKNSTTNSGSDEKSESNSGNVTQELLIGHKESTFVSDLTEQDKSQIESWVQSYLVMLDSIAPSTAIIVLSEADKGKRYDCPYRKTSIYPLIERVYSIFKFDTSNIFSFGPSGIIFKYVHFLFNKKIIEIGLNSDVIANLFLVGAGFDKVIETMNLLSRAVRFLEGDTDHFMPFYGEEHETTLKFLMLKKNLSSKQSISEIRGINDYQAQALRNHFDDELRGRHLRMFKENIHEESEFSCAHRNALKYFTKKGFSPESIMTEITGLTTTQVTVLVDLFDAGFRGDHLRSWRPGKYADFGKVHVDTIKFLLNQGEKPQEAVDEIGELKHECCSVLQELYSFGLRGNHFRERRLIADWSDTHSETLISLVRDQNVPLKTALNEIQKIKNVPWYVETLGRLYRVGLRARDLACYLSPNPNSNNFTREHCDLLAYLIESKQLIPATAVFNISKLTSYAAKAVHLFYDLGLRGYDLSHKNFTHHDLEVLSNCVKSGMPVKEVAASFENDGRSGNENSNNEKTENKKKYSSFKLFDRAATSNIEATTSLVDKSSMESSYRICRAKL